MALVAACVWAGGSGGCRTDKEHKPGAAEPAAAPAQRADDGAASATPRRKPSEVIEVPERPTRFAAAKRVVAIGDVHGDLGATRAALRLAGVLDEDDHWNGGATVLVQTGDQLDRGDDEPQILELLERLTQEARAAGGALHVLNGNHELMNAIGDFRYVTEEGFEDFADVDPGSAPARTQVALRRFEGKARGRAAAFLPGGPWAKKLAQRNTAVIVGDTVFVHGGVEPKWATQLDALNQQARAFMIGAADDAKEVVSRLMAPDGLVWSRAYSEPQVGKETCAELARSLHVLGATRMVVGHTVQKGGITSACDEKVWRIDVGMAEHYGGSPQVLQIQDGEVSVLEGTG